MKEALKGVGVTGITITEVKGFGRQGGHTETYRGAEYNVEFIPKIKLEAIVPTEDAEKVASVITAAAQTGKIGDGSSGSPRWTEPSGSEPGRWAPTPSDPVLIRNSRWRGAALSGSPPACQRPGSSRS